MISKEDIKKLYITVKNGEAITNITSSTNRLTEDSFCNNTGILNY
jgi:hypothetical protein